MLDSPAFVIRTVKHMTLEKKSRVEIQYIFVIVRKEDYREKIRHKKSFPQKY